jgi:hypothetical protein
MFIYSPLLIPCDPPVKKFLVLPASTCLLCFSVFCRP